MDTTFSRKVRRLATKVWDWAVQVNEPELGTVAAPVEVSQALLDGTESDIHAVASSVHGLHHILKYDQYDPKTGLFYNDNSVSFCFEVMPQTGADDEMANRLNQLFTPIPPGYGIQWTLFGNPVVDVPLLDFVDLRHVAVDNGRTDPFFVELAQRRAEFVRKSRGLPLFKGSNFMVKSIRLLFSVTRSGTSDDHKLCEEMWELRETLNAQLKTSGLPASPVDAEGLIRFLKPILNPQLMFGEQEIPETIYDEGRSIKEQITAFGQHVEVRHNEILFGAVPQDESERDNRIAVQAYGVQQYPKKKELWEMVNIIGSFFDDGLQYPCPFLISGGVYTLNPTEVDAQAQIKSARAKQNAKSKMAEYQPELGAKAEDWSIVMHQLNDGGTMAELYHTLLLFSPRKTMNRAAQVAANIWKSERFTIGRLDALHLPLLYCSLPMTLTNAMRRDLKTFRVMTTKTSMNAVDMSPVIGEWQGAGDPVLMFFGRRGTPTFLDFYANQQGNYNIFVTGVSGAGKSVAMNEIVSAYRGIGGRVWVVEVGRAYRNLIRLQKGTLIDFDPRQPICINPFSWVGADSELDFKDELRMLKPMIARMASPSAPISEFQYALIGASITAVWNDYGPDSNPTLIRDHLLTLKNEKGEPERLAYELAMQLQPFTEVGIHGKFFNGPATINLDGDMIGLELEELKSAPDLRRVTLFVMTSRIAHDMYLSRDRKKLCLIDEAWQLLGDDQETADFIEEGYRRARKYEGMFAVGTQGIQDAYKNKASAAAFNNADWKIYLRQDRKSLEKLIKDGVIDFSPAVKRMLLSLRTEHGQYSEMLISSPSGDAVVRHIPDPFSLLMASSKASDFTEAQALLDQGYSTMQTLELMLERRGIYA